MPASELAAILTEHFRHASQLDEFVVAYGEDERPALYLRYQGDALRRVEAGPGLTERDVTVLADVVDREVRQTESYVGRAILFALAPTTGWFRYRDRFQLLPVPPDAPQPPQLLADYPFIAEFAVRRSDVVGVQWARETAAEQEVRLLLGGLLGFRVTGQRWLVSSAWVTARRSDGQLAPPNDGVVFAQHYYSYDGFKSTVDDFSPTTGLPHVPVEPDDAHYGGQGHTFEAVLSVPESLPALLDTFFSLDEDDHARVLRACYWLVHAHEVRKLSRSAAYTSLVHAIEALLPDSRRSRACTECGRPTGPGPTRLFRDFVETHVPDTDHKARRTLYEVRSRIVHGGRLLLSDLHPGGRWLITPSDTHESRLFDIARTASQVGLVTWLKHRGDSRSLLHN